VTIALNLLRDESRRHHEGTTEHIPDVREPVDVEAAGIARAELNRVLSAMSALTPAQRSALLREIGNGNGNGHTNGNGNGAAAEKMLRMRARRKLREALEKVSGLVLWRLRRLGNLFNGGAWGGQDTLVQGIACVGCLTLGLAVVAPSGVLSETGDSRSQARAIASVNAGAQSSTDLSLSRDIHATTSAGRAQNENELSTRSDAGRHGDTGGAATGSGTAGSTDTGKGEAEGGGSELPIDSPDLPDDPENLPEELTGMPLPKAPNVEPAPEEPPDPTANLDAAEPVKTIVAGARPGKD
jgi:hypothetical protein